MANIYWCDQRRPRWREGGREAFAAERGWSDAHPDHMLIWFGRCRSGNRWFWAAASYGQHGEHGWTDTEQDAIASACAIVERLAGDKPAMVTLNQGYATAKLKQLNATKRAARPTSEAKGSSRIEYLYGYTIGGEESDGNPVRFVITKRTAKRVFYLRHEEYLDANGAPDPSVLYRPRDEEIGFVDREKLEKTGEVYNRGRHWSEPDYHLYASFQACVAWRNSYQSERVSEADLHELKMAMAAAHPDRGGNSRDFIEARQRYLAAKRAREAA